MKLFTTLIQRITALTVVLVMAIVANAADRTFATLAEMHADATLAEDDQVTITGDLVIEYIFESYFVLRDKEGTATCVNYNYNFKDFNRIRLEGLEEYPETPPVKPGDIFKGYTARFGYASYTTMPLLQPELDMDNVEFVGFTAVYADDTNYVPTTVKTSVRQLLDNPDEYIGKVVSLDEAKTVYVEKKFASYLVQGEDTLKNFRISGLDDAVYPNTLIITKALCTAKYGGGCKLELSQTDYISEAFTEIKAVKATALTENIPLDLTAQVLRKETYEGKTYITIMNGEGKYLLNYSGIRILLNEENEVDKTIQVGDYINLKTSTARLVKQVKEGNKFTLSQLILDEHETAIVSNGVVNFLIIAPEEIAMLSYYEYLPASLNGYVTLSGQPTAEQIAHNVSPALLTTIYGDSYPILLDLTYMPKAGTRFVVKGILDIPMWMGSSDKPVVTPISEDGFMADSYAFESIAEMLEFGAPMLDVVNYELKNAVTITGIETILPVGADDQIQNIIFVADATGSLLLKGVTEYKVGDAISKVSGFYSAAINSYVAQNGVINFGVSNFLLLDTTGVEFVSVAEAVEPVEVTIAQLLASDEYASKLVKLIDFTYKKVEEVVQDTVVDRLFIYQGTDSMAVDGSFELQEDKSVLVGNYYLNGFYTSVIPYMNAGLSTMVETIIEDDKLFVANNTIYAQDSAIEVYDVMGRLLATGVNAVCVENCAQSIFVVKTIRLDGVVFVTKVANR